MIGLLAASLPTLPVPSTYRAGHTAAWLFTLWAGGFAVLALPYCIYRLRKHQDVVPLFAWLGGFILSLGEPMLDYLGHLWWPENLPGPAFTGYGLHVPLLIPPCYAFFVSMTGYFAYRQFQRGLTVKRVFYVWLAILSTDFLLEFPGVLTHVYKYYGKQPFYIGNFPLHWAWLNGTGFLMVGFLLWLVVPRLQGAQRALILLVPLFAFLGSYGMTAMPAFASLNWEMSRTAQHIVDLASLGLCLIVVRGIAEAVRIPETVVASEGRPVVATEGDGELVRAR
jgi:hypothetical protein